MIILQRSDYKKMLAHSLSERPDEACGVIEGDAAAKEELAICDTDRQYKAAAEVR